MALIPTPKRQKVLTALAEVENRIHSANRKLKEETDPENKLDATYKGGLDASAKTDIGDCFKILDWLRNDFGLADPALLDDAGIDAINPLIRQIDDGQE
jgi:hypothetical protein